MSLIDKFVNLLWNDDSEVKNTQEVTNTSHNKAKKNQETVVFNKGKESEEEEYVGSILQTESPKDYKVTDTFKKPVIENVRLVIFLVEKNNESCSKSSSILTKRFNYYKRFFNTAEYMKFITYGSSVKESKMFSISSLNTTDIENVFKSAQEGGNACLYDALISLERVVSENMFKVIEEENYRHRIEGIEIVGIGRCIDNCSKNSKEVSIQAFNKMLKNKAIVTKYICHHEETFANAAEIGFRSIASGNKEF